MSGKVSDLPIRYKRAVFTQKKLDRKNFRSGNGGRVLRNPPDVTRCWSRAWSHGNGRRRNICQKRLSERLDINKICGGFINIRERIKIMWFTKRH